MSLVFIRIALYHSRLAFSPFLRPNTQDIVPFTGSLESDVPVTVMTGWRLCRLAWMCNCSSPPFERATSLPWMSPLLIKREKNNSSSKDTSLIICSCARWKWSLKRMKNICKISVICNARLYERKERFLL